MTRLPCPAECDVVGAELTCELEKGHDYQHEANAVIEVRQSIDTVATTPFIVWWSDDGKAFVGSNNAVNLQVLRQRRHLVAVPPTRNVTVIPHVCDHDLHVEWSGRRLGLLIHPSGNAAMLDPCTYVNKDGM